MTDTKKLAAIVKKSTLPAAFLADQMHISTAAYLQKAEGKRQFTAAEIAILKHLLCLTDAETTKIFFCGKFKAYCIQNGIKQAELCKLLNIKNVSRKLNGQQPFTLQQVKTLCKNYHISADDYFA